RGEIAGDLPAFERVADSLRANLPPGADTTLVAPMDPAGTAGQPTQNSQGGAVSDEDLDQDPFAGLDLD
ncbi:MAG: hypothetical protein HC829_08995, partial [Bacteroidales bacterium]|nr:hypothetical protein [Bacteroidales bacterium]